MRSAALLSISLLVGAAGGDWEQRAPLPTPRSEVAAVVLGGEAVVVGGFLATGDSSSEVDAYSPAEDRWRRLPDLPIAVNHVMAAAASGKLYVVGGYGGGFRTKLRFAFVLENGRWSALPRLPAPRAAGGAAIVGGRLYVVGGVGPSGLARQAFALDLGTRRWTAVPGPTPREHLAVTAVRSRVYALAGRKAGIDTNLAVFEVYDPKARRWRTLPPVPDSRGGTAAASARGLIVSAGGEAPGGTTASVYGFDLDRRLWRRLPDLPTPRHGLGLAALGGRIYALAGGTEPGLSVSDANESLPVP